MEIRLPGSMGLNVNKTAKGINKSDSRISSHDRFTRDTATEVNLIDRNIKGLKREISGDQNKNEVQTETGGNFSFLKSAMDNSVDTSINAATPGLMSPPVGAAFTISPMEPDPQMQKAFDIIAKNAERPEDIREDYKSFKNILDKDMDPAEMADFFVYGNRFHSGERKEKERLIHTSLKIYNEFILDDKGNYKGTSREERAECFKLLLEAIPPTKKESPFCMGDSIRPLYHVNEALNSDKLDQYAVSCIGRDFGYGYEDISFTPEKAQGIGIVDGTKKFIHLLNIVQNAGNRESPDFKLNDDDKGFHSLSIIRGVFHYDTGKTKEFEGLLGIVGDPWIALGIMKNLDNIDADLRNVAKKHLLSDLRKTGMSRSNCSQVTTSLASVYEIMKPGEDFESIKSESRRVFEQIKEFTSDKTHPNLVNYFGAKRLKMVGKYREKDETLTDSFNRYREFATKLTTQGMGLETVDKIYEMTGKEHEGFLEVIPGASTYGDVNNEVGDIIENEWLGRQLPPEKSPDLIEIAIQKIETGESLREKCAVIANDYFALGDFSKKEELQEMVDHGFKNGDFGNADKKEISADIEHNIRLRRVMGDSPGEALKNAYKKVRNSIQAAEEMKKGKSGIQMNNDFIMIGGVRIDIKKRK